MFLLGDAPSGSIVDGKWYCASPARPCHGGDAKVFATCPAGAEGHMGNNRRLNPGKKRTLSGSNNVCTIVIWCRVERGGWVLVSAGRLQRRRNWMRGSEVDGNALGVRTGNLLRGRGGAVQQPRRAGAGAVDRDLAGAGRADRAGGHDREACFERTRHDARTRHGRQGHGEGSQAGREQSGRTQHHESTGVYLE